MVAQGVPFAREYGGLLDNRSFGGAQVSRTFYAEARPDSSCCSARISSWPARSASAVSGCSTASSCVDTVVIDGRCAGIVTRDLMTGDDPVARRARSRAGNGRLRQRVLPVDERDGVQRHRGVAGAPPRRVLRQPVLHADPPDVHPAGDEIQSKLTLMCESLRNDGRVWVPKNADDRRPPDQIPEDERDYYLERLYPSFGNLAPRDIASRAAKRAVDAGRGVGPLKNGVYLDFADAIDRLGRDGDRERYGEPVRDVRAHHRRESLPRCRCASIPAQPLHDGRSVGRLRADDHHARVVLRRRGQLLRPRRQPARARRRSCRAWPTATSCCRPRSATTSRRCSASRCRASITPSSRRPRPRPRSGSSGYLAIKGTRSLDWFHRELGRIIWDYCGMERTERGAARRRCRRCPRCTPSSRRICVSPATASR